MRVAQQREKFDRANRQVLEEITVDFRSLFKVRFTSLF